MRPPSRSAVQRRVARLDQVKATAAREGRDAARARRSAGGAAPPVTGLLQRVQIDHTSADVIVVDEHHRLPIGRPYVTAAIDKATKCVPGLVITLEAPSATSVGLCLAHMVIDKRPWLERIGVEAVWPVARAGVPRGGERVVDVGESRHAGVLQPQGLPPGAALVSGGAAVGPVENLTGEDRDNRPVGAERADDQEHIGDFGFDHRPTSSLCRCAIRAPRAVVDGPAEGAGRAAQARSGGCAWP
ncbi:hypothetical protein ABIA39_009126, partial [Nocardia sp. GAS34]